MKTCPNHNIQLLVVLMLTMLVSACASHIPIIDNEQMSDKAVLSDRIQLPEPDLTGTLTLEEALVRRRSVRQFQSLSLTDAHVGQLLWAAQGVTHPAGLRTAPSAGARYPLEVYAATQDGLYRYHPGDHSLEQILAHDPRPDLHPAALRQDAVRDAPLVIVITGVFSRTAQRYGDERTPQYVYLEAGHAGQNILLQAVALGLDAVPIGAFYEDQVSAALSLPADEIPLYIIPIGHPE